MPNKTIEEFTRQQIKEKLEKLPPACTDMFIRMYGHFVLKDKTIANVIDKMPAERLDWALTQVENTEYNR